MTNLQTKDVRRFLGRRLTPAYQGEILSDYKNQHEAIRVKHLVDISSLKMYDKAHPVLPVRGTEPAAPRIQSTMNKPSDFTVRRKAQGKPDGPLKPRPLRKGIAESAVALRSARPPTVATPTPSPSPPMTPRSTISSSPRPNPPNLPVVASVRCALGLDPTSGRCGPSPAASSCSVDSATETYCRSSSPNRPPMRGSADRRAPGSPTFESYENMTSPTTASWRRTIGTEASLSGNRTLEEDAPAPPPADRDSLTRMRCSEPMNSFSEGAITAAAASACWPLSPIRPSCVPSWRRSAEIQNRHDAPQPGPLPPISSRPECSTGSRIPVQMARPAVASSHFVSVASRDALSFPSPSQILRKGRPQAHSRPELCPQATIPARQILHPSLLTCSGLPPAGPWRGVETTGSLDTLRASRSTSLACLRRQR